MMSYSKKLSDREIAINHQINRYITLTVIVVAFLIAYFI